MKKIKLIFSFIFSIVLIFIFLFFIFLWWNNSPPLYKRSRPHITSLKIAKNENNSNINLKVATYNIHFGIGINVKTLQNDKNSYIKRLNKTASIIKDINADVILLQEVDFNSKRSFFINQGEYLASQAGYNFIATAPTLRKKIHIFFNKIIGKIDCGMCILSRHPIEYNEAIIFDYSKEIPFFINWLYDPHGAQKSVINYNGKKISFINLHLEPWSQFSRQSQVKTIKDLWLTNNNTTIIIGGDFNTVATAVEKNGFAQNDAPWFVDKSKWDLKNETTIHTLLHMGFKEVAPAKLSLKNTKYFTYPSNDPKEKIDHIFVGNKARIIKGYIYHEAHMASDHLPLIAEIKMNGN